MIGSEEHQNTVKVLEAISDKIDWDAFSKTPSRILPPQKIPDKVYWTPLAINSYTRMPSSSNGG